MLTITDLHVLEADEPEGSKAHIPGDTILTFFNFRDFNAYRP